jgi:hypothetical protein
VRRLLPEPADDGSRKFARSYLPVAEALAENIRRVPAFLDRLEPGVLDLFGHLVLPDVVEQQDGSLDQAAGVGQVLALLVESGTIFPEMTGTVSPK